MICFGILVMFCQPQQPPPVADSFCTTYQKVIRAKGEGSISGPLAVRQRIAANEVTYRRLCERK